MASETESLASENLFNLRWTNFKKSFEANAESEPRYFERKSDAFHTFWTFFAKEFHGILTDSIQHKVLEVIRLNQKHFIHPEWRQNGDDIKKRVLMCLTSANRRIQECSMAVRQEFFQLKQICTDPWSGYPIANILAGKVQSQLNDYFLGESLVVAEERLKILMTMGVPKVAFNLCNFIVANVFNSERKQSSPILRRWVENNVTSDVGWLLDFHIGLMFTMGKDGTQIYSTLKPLDVKELISGTERYQIYTKSEGRISHGLLRQVWQRDQCKTAFYHMTELCMILACKNKTDQIDQTKIINLWLSQFEDVSSSDFEVDFEKFLSIDSVTSLVYELIVQTYQKFGEKSRLFCVEAFVRALTRDINRLEVARDKKDTKIIQEIERSLSRGLMLLAEMFSSNLTMRRECTLTAFTLHPSENLFKKIVGLAEESGFVDAGLMEADTVGKGDEVPNTATQDQPQLMEFSKMDFTEVTENLMTSLSKGYGKGQSKLRADAKAVEKRERNLEALVTVQGDLITEASNYDPTRLPMKTLTSATLRLPQRLVDDLLVVIEAPRWHLLSWVLDWHALEEYCLSLLKNPDLKNCQRELRHLVIDYTQFDEWSSDEEFAPTGIEKGYEHWEKYGEDDDNYEENGLSDIENLEFNVVQPVGAEQEEPSEEFSREENYLPCRLENSEQSVQDSSESSHFLAEEEGTKAANSDVAVSRRPDGPLRKESSSDPDTGSSTLVIPNTAQSTTVGLVQLFHGPNISLPTVKTLHGLSACEKIHEIDPQSETVRQKLREIVPGLTDFSFFEPRSNPVFRVGVVHVTLASQSSAASSSATSSASSSSAPATPSKIVLEPASSSASVDPPQGKTAEPKIQYVYKHGTQTIVVDRPLTDEELSKLKFPLPNNRLQSPVVPGIQQPKPAVVVSRPASVSLASLPAAGRPVSSHNSVDTLANTLISQIQTPLQFTPSSQPIKTEDPELSALPKFQLAFGQETNSSHVGIKVEPGSVVVKSEPEMLNGKSVAKPNYSPKIVPVTSVSNLAASPILAGQLTLQTSTSPAVASHSDLIRQLNLARAQGLVVLQQWGDKQVLVHKATGRWIMRQGNRLVTVPPQALGIQTAQSRPPAGTVEVAVSSTASISSSTMEQLREFDSILESKFKTTTGSMETSSSSVSSSPAAVSSAPTFVILSPHQNSTQKNELERKTVTSPSSAPTSPAKPIKIHQSSISASASPLGPGCSSLGFTKPTPKTQEDPDTLKRIQQILDDYNEQIRNSPDLQNRPAPRRRSNGPTVGQPNEVEKRKRLNSLSPPPSNSSLGTESDVGSPSVVQISPVENGSQQISTPTTLKLVQKPHTDESDESGAVSTSGYSVVRQIVVPQSLAASLQASGRQLMVVTGPGGKKMVALKPVYVSTATSTTPVSKFIAVSSGSISNSARLVTSSSNCLTSPAVNAANAIAALKSAVPVPASLLSSTGVIRSNALPTFSVATSRSPLVSSPFSVLTNSTSERSSPLLAVQSGVLEERPSTPGLGIPMEMTPGQIMEAEISAANLLDDNPESPFALVSSASSSASLHRRKLEDEESLSETLPENLFTVHETSPATGIHETSSDEDDYRSEYGKRRRTISSASSSEELSTLKRSRVDHARGGMSQQKSVIGICINESSQFLNN